MQKHESKCDVLGMMKKGDCSTESHELPKLVEELEHIGVLTEKKCKCKDVESRSMDM